MAALEEIRNELRERKESLAFVFGNGINRYACSKARVGARKIAWDGMLLALWEQVCGEEFYMKNAKGEPEIPSEGISYTEFYSILENFLQNDNKLNCKNPKARVGLKARTKAYVEKNINIRRKYHHWLHKQLAEVFDCPVLTTNYDYNIEEGMTLDPDYRQLKYYTNKFLMESYMTDGDGKDPFNEFCVWHVNGALRFASSLRIGLADYMSIITQASDRISEWQKCRKNGLPMEDITFNKSWLRLFFEKDLCIVGLSLDTNEILLRWLLIERKKFFDNYPDLKRKTWYVSKNGDVKKGMEFFLNFLDIDFIGLDNYQDVYEGVFL
jgi:hypothetical protein